MSQLPSSFPPRPSPSLAGKVAIVTGAGSTGDNELGNGRAIAILLVEAGASVVCVDREAGPAKRTAEIIRSEFPGAAALAIQGDVTNEDDCRRIVNKTTARFNRLDVLVNNVGIIGARGTAPDVDVSQWAQVWRSTLPA